MNGMGFGLVMVFVVALWVLWAIGAFLGNAAITETAMALFNFTGAMALFDWSSRTARLLRTPLTGLGVGLAIIGIGFGFRALSSAGLANFTELSNQINLVGALVAFVSAAFTPWGMERSGLVANGHALKVTVGSGVLAAALTAVATLVRPLGIYELGYFFTSAFIAVLFVWNAVALAGGRISRTLQSLNIGLVLFGLSRVLGLVIPGTIGYRSADFAFLVGVTVLFWSALRSREQ